MSKNEVTRRGHESAFSVYAANAQVIASGVPVLVNMGTGMIYDLLDEIDPATYLFTPKRAGYYVFWAQVAIQNLAINDNIQIWIYQNALQRAYNTKRAGAVSDLLVNTSMSRHITPADTVSVRIGHDFGANRNLLNGENFCRFIGHRVK